MLISSKILKRVSPTFAYGCASKTMLLWVICVLLYWRKVNREAEITLQPCPFQLI